MTSALHPLSTNFCCKFSGFILKCSYCTPYPFQSILVLTHYIYIEFLWSKNDTRHITTFPVSTLHKKWSFPLRISSVNVTNFFSFLRIWSHLMKKSLMEHLIFCAVLKEKYSWSLIIFLLINLILVRISKSEMKILSYSPSSTFLLFCCRFMNIHDRLISFINR